MVFLLRLIHGLITAFFLSCIGYLYYSALRGQVTLWTWLVIAALFIEGLVVLLNHGDCPLGMVHHKYGDDKAFFELFLPKQAAKRAVPFFGTMVLIAVVIVVVRVSIGV